MTRDVLVELMGVDSNTFYRVFKLLRQMTPTDYQATLRNPD